MKKQKLGSTDIEVSVLAQGTDVIGSKLDRETSYKMLDHYFGSGGNFLDTGNFYASWLDGFVGGESETMIGEWMNERKNRSQIILSSKLGFDYPGSPGGLSAREIQSECDKSLKRLGTDHIDLYYAHRDDRSTSLEETMEAFHRLIAAGKVRAIGASNLSVWRVAEANAVAKAHGWTPYSVVQQRYTYLRPRYGADFGPQIFINEDMKDFAQTEGLALIAFSVLLQGTYTRSDRPLPAQFAGPDSDSRLQALKSVAASTGRSPNQVVIAWMMQSTPEILPIIAGSSTEQFDENIAALNLKLTPEDMQILTTAGNPVIENAWLQS